jgi:hypothetical protein
MILLFFSFTAIQAQDTSAIKKSNIMFTALEVLPLPHIEGYSHGDTPIEVNYQETFFDQSNSSIDFRGIVLDRQTKEPIAGIRVLVGSLNADIFTLRTSVVGNENGAFHLSTRIYQTNFLIITWLGYLEKVYRLKDLFENHE